MKYKVANIKLIVILSPAVAVITVVTVRAVMTMQGHLCLDVAAFTAFHYMNNTSKFQKFPNYTAQAIQYPGQNSKAVGLTVVARQNFFHPYLETAVNEMLKWNYLNRS